MGEKEFVTRRVAELLNEKGFDEVCDWYYPKNGGEIEMLDIYELNYCRESFISAPTVQAARDWLEDKYGFFIEIGRSIDTNATYHYRYLIIDKLCNVVFKQHTDFLSSYEAANAALECCFENLT